jgi:ABC-type transport system involved in cytochrome bd biosynthesis fused ATPase/permease subunit
MVETGVDFEDELILAMREELERVFAEEKRDTVNAESSIADADAECERRKRTMMGVLAASVRTQRLYFVIRSAIMSLISALMFFIVVLYLGTIDAAQAVFLGIFLFVASLVLSRLFDKPIVNLSKSIVNFLNRHKRARAFVLKKL